MTFTGCNYTFSLNANGTCCRFILVEINAFFNGLAGIVITDIQGNVVTTKDIFIWPPVR
jgi:hypothetical protein